METDLPHEDRNASQNSHARQGNSGTKFRASCDRCSSTKVRCGQDRPSCQRCLYLNIPCNYSASRRMGRASGRSGNDRYRIRTSARKVSKAESYFTDTISEISESPKNDTQRLSDTGLLSYGQDFDCAALEPWNDANFMSDLPGSPNFASFSDHQADASNLAQPQLATTQMEATLSDFEQLDFAAPFQNNASPNPNCIRMESGQSAFQQPSPNFFTSPNTIPDQASSIAHLSTSCVELVSSTLHSLSLPSSMCTSSPHPMPLHTVEQVLATSRGGISAFNRILECPCSPRAALP